MVNLRVSKAWCGSTSAVCREIAGWTGRAQPTDSTLRTCEWIWAGTG